MSFELADLPYGMDALAPFMSKQTLEFHHDKHHAGYVAKLNAAIEDTAYVDMSLEEIIQTSWDQKDSGVFNNAAQAWNHSFFWKSMCPNGGGVPTEELAHAIAVDFGSFEEFAEEFAAAGAARFGSGWVWLVAQDGKLSITHTANADTPLTAGAVPLLTMDVWEHAYYLDYQNRRHDYVSVFLEYLSNWDFASRNYAAIQSA